MIAPRVAVLQFPGVNCESETVRALERASLSAEIFRWTRAADGLREFDAYVLPGGFSYQDRVRAGALASKESHLDVLAEEAGRGRPVLGICNGAQVLVEAGLVPGGGSVALALARNRMPGRSGYYARWIYMRVEPSPCLFFRGLEPGAIVPLPVAHGEGRFTGDPERMKALRDAGQVPLRYADADGSATMDFPANPSRSEEAAAAVCNPEGNVLAIMPHPERAIDAGVVPRAITGAWDEARERRIEGGEWSPGPGLQVFDALRRHLEES